jgi:hypothetical protein
MDITVSLRTIVAFAVGLAFALIAVFVFHAWRVDAAPGDVDTTFVPITPCRLIDTRPAPDHIGSISTFGPTQAQTVTINVHTGSCSEAIALAAAEGLELNVTAIGATAPTFITMWPFGTGKPLASSLNPSPGEPPTPNAVTVGLNQNSFEVYNQAGNVDLIIDVTGYYTNTSLRDLASRVASLEAQVGSLEDRQPNAFYTNPGPSDAVTDWETVAVLEFDRPASAGSVIVNYGANVIEPDVGETVRCQLGSSEGPGLVPAQSFVSTGSVGFLSGTAGFGLIGGSPQVEVRLQCSSSNGATIIDASITASYWPSP